MKNRTLKITAYEEKNRQQVLNAGKVFPKRSGMEKR